MIYAVTTENKAGKAALRGLKPGCFCGPLGSLAASLLASASRCGRTEKSKTTRAALSWERPSRPRGSKPGQQRFVAQPERKLRKKKHPTVALRPHGHARAKDRHRTREAMLLLNKNRQPGASRPCGFAGLRGDTVQRV